ncbi:two-component sensor histidine kinase, partial [Aliarcobacter butzleri]
VTLRQDRPITEYVEALNTSLEEISGIEHTINDLLFLAKNAQELSIDKQEEFYLDELADDAINELKNSAKLHKITISLIVE